MPARLKGAFRADQFVGSTLRQTPTYANRYEVLRATLQRAERSGLVMEFGVFRGDSIRRIAEWARAREDPRVFGFDTFEGLPEDWTFGFRRGAFKVEGLPQVPENVTLIKGLFQDTLGPFLEQHREPAAFVHIDSDLYSSAKFVLETLHSSGQLVETTIVVFDELFGQPDWWTKGEFKALQEFARVHALNVSYFGRAVAGGSVATVLRKSA